MEERVQKILARAGYGSRRSCEELITAGRVTVNGKIAELGTKADPASDKIMVDLHPIPGQEKLVYIALHKPRGVLSAVIGQGDRPTVRDLVNVRESIYPVGRLDLDSEGLILLTNDGDLANKITHPRFGHEKEYRVLVGKKPDEAQLAAWRRGVVLEDGTRTQPADVTVDTIAGRGAWLKVIMREGRKRQIRETGKILGIPVLRIVRIRIGEIRLGQLKTGEWRYLSDLEVKKLKQTRGSERRPKPIKKSGVPRTPEIKKT